MASHDSTDFVASAALSEELNRLQTLAGLVVKHLHTIDPDKLYELPGAVEALHLAEVLQDRFTGTEGRAILPA